MFRNVIIVGVCALVALAGIAGVLGGVAGAATPEATLLVLQPADVPDKGAGPGPQLTASDGYHQAGLSSPAKYGREAGAVAEYAGGSGPRFLTSRAVVFRDAAGAHGAFLEVSAELAQVWNARPSVVSLGQEAHQFSTIVNGFIVWRHGNVLGYLRANPGSGGDALRYAQLQQARIAALVPASDPGPPVVVKPVIGKPTATPRTPISARRFSAVFPITRSDDGNSWTGGGLAMSVKLASIPIAHQYNFRNGGVTLALPVPRAAKGKRLTIVVRVRADGQAATKTISYTVR